MAVTFCSRRASGGAHNVSGIPTITYVYFVSGERGSKKLKRTKNRTYLHRRIVRSVAAFAAWNRNYFVSCELKPPRFQLAVTGELARPAQDPTILRWPVACGESGGNGLRPAHRRQQKGAKQAEPARTQRKIIPRRSGISSDRTGRGP
jgi:hypothetical protein